MGWEGSMSRPPPGSREDVDADQSPSRWTPAIWAPSLHQQGPPPGSRGPLHEAEQRKPHGHRHRRSPELARQPPQVPATSKARRKGGGTWVTLVATRVARADRGETLEAFVLSIMSLCIASAFSKMLWRAPSICVLVAADMATLLLFLLTI